MELTFRKAGELEVTSDFNLHVERSRGGTFLLYSRTAGDRYDLVDGFGYHYSSDVIDYDFTALVWPKTIKIVSEVEPTLAVVTCPEGEVTEIKPTLKFTVEGEEFLFEEGMTWMQWEYSEYNTVRAFMSEAFLRFDTSSLNGYLADEDSNHIAAMYASPIANYAYTLNPKTPY